MYIKIGDARYAARKPAISRPAGVWWRIELTETPELELPISGTLAIYSDSDEALATVSAAVFQRQTYTGGILLLTNEPEPEPTPEPYADTLLSELRERKIHQSKADLSAFLERHPMEWTDGNLYSVTEEKQNLLTSQLALQSIAAQAGVERELKWNTTGGVCTAWSFEALSALALAIGAYVQPLVTYQQTAEVAIRAAETVEALEAMEIDYYTVYPELRTEDAS